MIENEAMEYKKGIKKEGKTGCLSARKRKREKDLEAVLVFAIVLTENKRAAGTLRWTRER